MLLPVITGLLFAALAWRDLKTALLLIVAVSPVYLWRLDTPLLPTTMLEMWVWIFFVVWLTKSWHRRKDQSGSAQKSIFLPVRLPILLFLIAGMFSVIAAGDTAAALGLFKAYLVEPLLVFVALVSLFDQSDLPRIFRALALSVTILSAIAIVQVLSGLGIPAPWDIEGRATSIFEYPNALGLFVAPLIAAFAFLPRDRFHHAIALQTALGAVAIVLSKTEAAWVSIPAAILLVWFFFITHTKHSRLITIICLAGAISVFFTIPSPFQPLRNKILLADWSGQVRHSQWSETWNMLTDEPQQFLLGAGLSGYPAALAPYHTDKRFEIFQYPHNVFLNIWTELGLLGLLAFLLLAIALMRITWQSRANPYVLAAFAGLLQMTIHGLVDVPYFKNDLAIITWALVAILLVSSKKQRSTSPSLP